MVAKKPTGAYDAALPLPTADGSKAYAPAFVSVGADGNPLAGNVYQLASNIVIAANDGSSQSSGVQGGSYLWDAQFTGTSIVLQALGSDGLTWRNVATQTTTGTIGVVVGQNATVRLFNPNGGGLTGVYSSLS